MTDQVSGLETVIAMMTGEASDIEQRAGPLLQSLKMLLEQVQELRGLMTYAPCTLQWHKDYPEKKYPTPEDWALMRRALAEGAVVLADVGPNVNSLHAVRLFTLDGVGEPTNADMLGYNELGNVQKRKLCPAFAVTPKLAIWNVTIYGTRPLGA